MEIDLTKKILADKEKKTLNKPFRLPKGDRKKFGVYVKNDKGNVVIVKFGDPNMEIKRDDKNRRKSFRARHSCDNPGPKTKARYWSCKMWERKKSVTDYLKGNIDWDEWNTETIVDQKDLLAILPSLSYAEEVADDGDCGCGDCDCGKSKASRPGPKSGAQTPAKPEERKRGSSKNKPGSAAREKVSNSEIVFSDRVMTALKNKVNDHNEKYKKKVSLTQLKKVYRRGAGAFSTSHRPGKTRGQWAMARVNMFLKMIRGGKVKDSYRKADMDIAKAHILFIYDQTIEEEIHFTMEELLASRIEIREYCIEHDEFYNFLDDPSFEEDDYSEAAQKYFGGQKREDLDDSDFLFPENRSFPIVTPQDVPDAISNFGRKSGKMSYNAFLRRLVRFLKNKGPKFMSALPRVTKEKIKVLNASKDPMDHMYESKRDAIKKAKEMGLKGYHEHKMEDGLVMYMPGPDHETFMKRHKEMI
jgi:hypothetical protein